MIYFFYGPDSYRRNQKLNSSIAEYRKKHPAADLAIFDLEEEPDDWMKARDFLIQPSMFVDSKVLVVKNSGEIKEKEWLKVLKSELETPHTFVFISDGKKPLKAFEFLLALPAKNNFFGELEGRILEMFVKKEAEARNVGFEKNALEYFLGYLASVPERSWVAISELEKISLAGFSQPIKFQDLKTIIAQDLNNDVFGTAREIVWAKTWPEKLKLLEKLLLQKKEPAYIFNSLAYSVRGKELVRLADYDVAIKSGNLDYEEALLDFVLF
jgi:DNA polymerase III delta subunit